MMQGQPGQWTAGVLQVQLSLCCSKQQHSENASFSYCAQPSPAKLVPSVPSPGLIYSRQWCPSPAGSRGSAEVLCRCEVLTKEPHLAALTQPEGQNSNKSKSPNSTLPPSWDDLCQLALTRIQLEESKQNTGLVSGEMETGFLTLHWKLYAFFISIFNLQYIHVTLPSLKCRFCC